MLLTFQLLQLGSLKGCIPNSGTTIKYYNEKLNSQLCAEVFAQFEQHLKTNPPQSQLSALSLELHCLCFLVKVK